MAEQLELFQATPGNRLTVAEAFEVLWKFHLGGKPSARPFNSNRKAICKSIGHLYFDQLTELDVERHLIPRRAVVGPQTIRHDLKMLTMLYNKLKLWKKKKYVIDGIDFSTMRLPEFDPTEDIKRPRTQKRNRILSREEFSRWIEHCPERLKERTYFALDTGLNPIDLRALKVSWYDPYLDVLDLARHKNGHPGLLPVTDRCRAIIMKAIREGREFILDWTNHDKEVEAVRKASGVYFWFGRDLRKTYGNQIYKLANNDYRMAQKALLHTDPRTTINHYIIETGEDLRPVMRELERSFC